MRYSRDWATYPILTMPEVPSVEIELIVGRRAIARAGEADRVGSRCDRQAVPPQPKSACGLAR